jgi:hypothetical protein
MIIENQASDGSEGAFVYGADYWFLDNWGGANAVEGPAVGRDTFDLWWTPPCVSIPAWQAAMDDAGNAGDMDARFTWRMIDADASGYGAENDSGTVCIESIEVDRIDIGDLSESGSAWADEDPTSAEWHTVVYGTATDVTYDSSGVTLGPESGTWDAAWVELEPGDTDFSETDLVDNYPFEWLGDTLYKLEVDASAPDATGESNPPDIIDLKIDSASNELFSESYVVPNLDRVAMPTQAGITYVAFCYSHNQSLGEGTEGTVEAMKRLRARIAIGSSSAITIFDNTGSVTIEAVRVTKVELPD